MAEAACPQPSARKRKLHEIEPDPQESVAQRVRPTFLPVRIFPTGKKRKLDELDCDPRESDLQHLKAWCGAIMSSHVAGMSGNAQQAAFVVRTEEPSAIEGPSQEQGYVIPAEREEGYALAVKEEQGDDAVSESEAVTRRMEVPNNKVGVLIGKAGHTIRYLQYNSNAKIQITRDLDADPHAATRPVEITGSLESVRKSEELINAVIAESYAAGRGIAAPEQFQMEVPNYKVGLIIGRMGNTIKSLQAKTGACIQLIPRHPPKGDEGRTRTLRVNGTIKQIDMAKELINQVMNQPLYDYQQRGPYQSNMKGMPHGGNGYDYYGGHEGNVPAQHLASNPTMGVPPFQANYNYEHPHPHASDYRHSHPYAPPQHCYGHRAPTQHPFGGHEASQPYLQSGAQSGYGQQQQFGKPPDTVPSQGPPPQSYGAPPMASQPGAAVYQVPAQPYFQNVSAPVQQAWSSSAPVQQPYALYEPAHATDWYNQPTASTGPYPQQGGQHGTCGQLAPGYNQAGPAGYTQYPTAQQGYPEQPALCTGGYRYEGFQYGCGRPAQPASGAAAISVVVQPGYTQAAGATTQQNHDQPVPQSGAYRKTVPPQPSYTQKEKETELQGMGGHAVMRIDQPLETLSATSHLAPKLKEEAMDPCNCCHEKHHPLENCPPCKFCNDEYHKPFFCPELACNICYQKHRPKMCPYLDSYPKDAPLNPTYEIICVCGNLFDVERWVCTHCDGTTATVIDKYCFMCDIGYGHAPYECPVHKERAAKYKRRRDEKKKLAASTVRERYDVESCCLPSRVEPTICINC